MKKNIFMVFVGLAYFSIEVEATLPRFVENNQSKEELVNKDNSLDFAFKLTEEHKKHFSEEWKRTQTKDAYENAYVKALESLGLLEDRQKIETHFRVVLEYADTRDLKFIAMKTLYRLGFLKEETLCAIERVVTHKNIDKDVIYQIFFNKFRILGERPVNFPLVGKQKFFGFLEEDIQNGERTSAVDCVEFLRISKEILDELPAKDVEKFVTRVVDVYSVMPRKIQIEQADILAGCGIKEKVTGKYEHLIVDEILKVASGIKPDEDYSRVKSMALFSLGHIAVENGFSEKSINNIKSMLMESDDGEIKGLLTLALFKVDDKRIEQMAYSALTTTDREREKILACRYFRERKDPSVISTYIEMLESLDPEKMMSKNEEGKIYWRKSSNITMVLLINEFRGVTTPLDDDFETVRKDILEWWDKNSSDERFYFKRALNGSE